ncbi:DUF5522 domain-containing protein [Dictyobacter formicarum]|uniref:Uncharacterized protein n=1 Tax=Dictyobacter formicarum TaxID=2778368 RepID=A0ABQ3VPD3_9CHLR|nr:DUF5522 domain-containing protein [Dictyobacter formicarum]GHO87228.1 hypothetical protein KSZ_52340 [Dictyobacter formicarum]
MYLRKEEGDWEVTANGLYVATRGYLIRRGFCCSNRCRNCPYINWHNNPHWQPLPAECIKRTRVSPKSIHGAQALLAYHEQALHQDNSPEEIARHQEMIAHYSLLLARWGHKK